jgi:D-alanyl-D-alanine carboxypeptidase/D-alanyl-D-alanine-endopeptidase (penicillin-binding protein 4)
MNKNRILFLTLVVILMFARQGGLSAGVFGTTAKQKIEAVLASPEIERVNTGMKVVCLKTGKTIFEQNSKKLFVPASNVKLITAYSALKTLTPGYVFKTEFATDMFADSSTVHNIYIKGYGDPSVTYADINLQALNVSASVRRVTGDVFVDSTYFDSTLYGRGWMWDDGISSWDAPVSPYSLEGNCIEVIVSTGSKPASPVNVMIYPDTKYAYVISTAVTADSDSIKIERENLDDTERFVVSGTLAAGSAEKTFKCAVSAPGIYAGKVFKELLIKYGVRVKGSVCEGATSSGAAAIDRYYSKQLSDTVRFFLKNSDNLTGECILKTMGAFKLGEPGDASKGITVEKSILSSMGIMEGSYTLADGSGLSMYNLLSPDMIVKVLGSAYKDFSSYPEFVDALPVAGVDGTLKDRLKNTPLSGFIRAKTGNMAGVSCVSGYMETKKRHMLAFSIMMNGISGPNKPCKNAQDEILKTMWECY